MCLRVTWINIKKYDNLFIGIFEKSKVGIFNTVPLDLLLWWDLTHKGSLICADVLRRTNMIVIAFRTTDEYFHVEVWSLSSSPEYKAVVKMHLNAPPKSVRLASDKLLVVFHSKIQIYGFSPSFGLLREINSDTGKPNIYDVTYQLESTRETSLLGFLQNNKVFVLDVSGEIQPKLEFRPHKHNIVNLCFNKELTMVATSAVKSTVVRIHSLETGQFVMEYYVHGRVDSICFGPQFCELLLVCDGTTVKRLGKQKNSKSFQDVINAVFVDEDEFVVFCGNGNVYDCGPRGVGHANFVRLLYDNFY